MSNTSTTSSNEDTVVVSKCLYNQQNTTVNEAIRGYLLTRPDLILLAGLPGIRVIGRRNIDRNKVCI